MTNRPVVIAVRSALVAALAVGLLLATTDLFTLFFYVSYATLGGQLAWRLPRSPSASAIRSTS